MEIKRLSQNLETQKLSILESLMCSYSNRINKWMDAERIASCVVTTYILRLPPNAKMLEIYDAQSPGHNKL
eukprot:c32894_g1_i1 orf=378-590(-)